MVIFHSYVKLTEGKQFSRSAMVVKNGGKPPGFSKKRPRGSEFGRLSLAGEFFHGGGWVWIPRTFSQKSGEETGMMPELAMIFEQISESICGYV